MKADAVIQALLASDLIYEAKGRLYVGMNGDTDVTDRVSTLAAKLSPETLAFALIDKWLGLGPDGAESVREQIAKIANEPARDTMATSIAAQIEAGHPGPEWQRAYEAAASATEAQVRSDMRHALERCIQCGRTRDDHPMHHKFTPKTA